MFLAEVLVLRIQVQVHAADAEPVDIFMRVGTLKLSDRQRHWGPIYGFCFSAQ